MSDDKTNAQAPKWIYVNRMQYMGCGYVINDAGAVSHDRSKAKRFESAEAAHAFANGKNWTHDTSVREGCVTYYLSDAYTGVAQARECFCDSRHGCNRPNDLECPNK